MGMFSTVTHDGKDIQFKTGWDDCIDYVVGDKIDWAPDPHSPGDHIDGVYSGCYGIHSPDCWVIIKGCVIVAVEPPVDLDDYARLYKQYGIKKPSRTLWSREAWKKIHGDNVCAYYVHQKMQETSFIGKILPAKRVD